MPRNRLLFGVVCAAACSEAPSRLEPQGYLPPLPPAVRAVIEAPSTALVGTAVTLDGSGSSPRSAVYAWSLVRAPGQGSLLAQSNEPVARLHPGGLGRFVVALDVRHGQRTDRAEVEIEVECGPSPVLPPLSPGQRLLSSDRLPPPCVDYTLPNGFSVPVHSTWTIEPGVTVEVGDGASIAVEGLLQAVSSSTVPEAITIRGLGAQAGAWRGIVVEDQGSLRLKGAAVENAVTAIETRGRSRVGLREVSILEATEAGVVLGDQSQVIDYGALVFGSGVPVAVSVPVRLVNEVRTGRDTLTSFETHYSVRGTTLHRPTTFSPGVWRFAAASDRVTLSAEIQVEPGATLEFPATLGLELAYSDFAFLGTPSQPITLRAIEASKGWPGLLVSQGAKAILQHVAIHAAGQSGPGYAPAPPASITVTSSQNDLSWLSVEDTELLSTPETAVWMDGSVVARCHNLSTSGSVVPACPQN